MAGLTKYNIAVSETALADLRGIPANIARTILNRVDAMATGLPGSVEKLRGHAYGYRLRVGDYRILFDLSGAEITVHRVLNRRDAYASQPGQKRRKGFH